MSQNQSQKKKATTIYNFGAGPAMMPEPVMQAVHAEWFDWQNRVHLANLPISHSF